jgi:hypothetical protein
VVGERQLALPALPPRKVKLSSAYQPRMGVSATNGQPLSSS